MQELIKNLVISVSDAGLKDPIYYGFHVLAFISVFWLAAWLGPKLGVTRKKSMLVVLIVYPIMYAWMLVQYWVESGFQSFGGQNIVRIFIWVPVISIIAAKILKIETKTICCLVAPLIVINHAVGHLGCILMGCCRGYAVGWGLYIEATGKYHFPIQPIESLAAFAIVIYVIHLMKKNNYVPDAKVYPKMLIWFGSTRFIFEFFRANEKLIWHCSSLSFHALFMAIVGVVALIIIHYRNKKSKDV